MRATTKPIANDNRRAAVESRMNSVIQALDESRAALRAAVSEQRSVMQRLDGVMESLSDNLANFHEGMENIRVDLASAGRISRETAGLMDDYLERLGDVVVVGLSTSEESSFADTGGQGVGDDADVISPATSSRC